MPLPPLANPPVSAAEEPLASSLRDAQGREISYLRLSITERCNFRCSYCSPPRPDAAAEELDADSMLKLVSVFARLGVRRVRLTGGEPLVRADVVELASRIRDLPGIGEIAVTTNGHMLERLAVPLHAAGVSKLNVSLDSLDPEKVRSLSGGAADLHRILAGIEASLAAGFASVKTNTVVMGGINDGEAAALIRWAWARGIVPRFIELMPFSHGRGQPVPTLELIERIRAQGIELQPEPKIPGKLPAGPAEHWVGEGGRVGFIGPLTRNFCKSCNRVRMTANGTLRACLGGTVAVPLAGLLADPQPEAAVARAVRAALLRKPDGHHMTSPEGAAILASIRTIGG